MPTTRTRVNRISAPTITSRAVELYAEGLPLVPIRDACVESDEMCTHAECDRLHEIRRDLAALLGLRPWHPCPLDEYETEPLIQHPSGNGWTVVGPIKDALEKAIGGRHADHPPQS